ncbi:hypothetical protein Cgig2_008091 [Carnegiea gigantea]|uniref:Uncharacterized protein n=1 Tax=Carnegiea gigantea TaxID=171969 RepID=A0A9Q1QSS7_9CARY|nr:hypothetical protein Cgig2_008091 [Carnegiea gigantea]
MAAINSTSSSLRCELRVLGAKNIETKQKGGLFIRCCLSTGNSRRIQLDTHESVIPVENGDYLFWNESFSLVCNSTEDPLSKLREESIVFELRWRPNLRPRFLEKAIGGSHSHLLASAEVAWKNVLDAPSMEVQKWVALNVVNDQSGTLMFDELGEGAKPWTLEIAIKVLVLESSLVSQEEIARRRSRRGGPCSCSSDNGDCCASCEPSHGSRRASPRMQVFPPARPPATLDFGPARLPLGVLLICS